MLDCGYSSYREFLDTARLAYVHAHLGRESDPFAVS